MDKEVKRMTVKEFRELGYIQELNRLFLHPLGLALEVVVDGNGNEHFGEVWDYRDDPEGMHYAEGVINPEKAMRIYHEGANLGVTRLKQLGYVVQPIQD